MHMQSEAQLGDVSSTDMSAQERHQYKQKSTSTDKILREGHGLNKTPCVIQYCRSESFGVQKEGMVLFFSPSSSAGVEVLPKIAFLWGKRPHCLTTSLHTSSMHRVLQCTWQCHHKSLPV